MKSNSGVSPLQPAKEAILHVSFKLRLKGLIGGGDRKDTDQ